MNRCKHVGKIIILEYITATTQHEFSGGLWWHDHDYEEYEDTIIFTCCECGMEKRYNRHRLPKWLQSKFDECLNQPRRSER